MFLSVGASTEAKALHVCSVGSVSTRHAVVCVFLAFIKITISPLTLAYLLNRNCTLLYSTPTPLYRYCISLAISGGERHSFVLYTHTMTHLTAVRCLHCYTAALSLCTLPAGPL